MATPLFLVNLFKTATGTAVGSKKALDVYIQGGALGDTAGKTALAKARIDYLSTPVTTAAYTELIASVGGTAVTELEIFDSSGQTLVLAVGDSGSEADLLYIIPGGNGRIPVSIPAASRIAIKAVSADADSGEISVNFYG